MQMRKMALHIDGAEVEYAPPPSFERQTMSSGGKRLLISVPVGQPDLFLKLARTLPPPLYVLYILHTPRGEGDAGRYQSTELSWAEVEEFLRRFGAYFAGDGRHDLWIYSPGSGQTLVWDRHDNLYVEGEPLDEAVATLADLGFSEAPVQQIDHHVHYYRPEFDHDAAEVLDVFDWLRTPLRPEDEQ